MKFHMFSTKQKANIYAEHLIHFDNYVSVWSRPLLKSMTSHKTLE